MSSLACYLIREKIDGLPIEQFDDVIDPDDQGPNLRRHGPFEGSGFEAALFVTEGPPREPMWTPFLREGFPDLTLPRTPAVAAVLVVRLLHSVGERYLARARSIWGRALQPYAALHKRQTATKADPTVAAIR